MVNDQWINLQCHNRFDFLNLKDNVSFHWALTTNRDTVLRGAFSPDCEPHDSVGYQLHVPSAAISQPHALALLHFDIVDAQGHTFLRQSFELNKPQMTWTGHGSGDVMVCDTTVRIGRKPTMAETLTQKGRLPQKYLLPLDNQQVKADIQRRPINGGEELSFTLTPAVPDASPVAVPDASPSGIASVPAASSAFLSELGLAFLLAPAIDRVQWIGYGPFASYPGRHQACRYGFWAKHKDDLYFEGNHSGIDAAFFSDEQGNGLLITGDSLSLNFEQTDRGIVLTVNAAVSGQGPKFAKTHFPGWQNGDPPVSATFQTYSILSAAVPAASPAAVPAVSPSGFIPASQVPAPFRPFATQYDTYLLRYTDITASDN